MSSVTAVSRSGKGTGGARDNVESHGRSKREWVELKEQAARDQKAFGMEARLGDEEALDNAVEKAGK